MATILWQHRQLTTGFIVMVYIHFNTFSFPVHLKCPVAQFIQVLFRGCPTYMISMDSIVYRVCGCYISCSGVEQIHLWMVDSTSCLSSATAFASNRILSDACSDTARITFTIFYCILSARHVVKSCFCKLTCLVGKLVCVRNRFFNTLSHTYLN